MTTLVALHHRGETWIGSDTMACAGDLRMEVGRKWVSSHGWHIGCSGTAVICGMIALATEDLLRDCKVPSDFCANLKKLYVANDVRPKDQAGPLSYGEWFILVRHTQIWSISTDLAHVPIDEGDFWAEGSGQAEALGAGHALLRNHEEIPAEDVVRSALEAAFHIDIHTGGKLWLSKVYPE